MFEKVNGKNTKTPIGIDVTATRFNCQISATAGEQNYAEAAYRVIVKDKKGSEVRDPKKITSDVYLGILYAGIPIKASIRYNWALIVLSIEGQLYQ
jgi:hypothetical protein